MTGPEHYQEAERLLAEAVGNSASMGQLAAVTATAQVHATLALAAAAGLGMGRETLSTPSPARIEWFRAAGPEGSAS
jgi:hypothetical protein